MLRKQRRAAEPIFDQLRTGSAYEGRRTGVKELEVEINALKQEVYSPLNHGPSEGQVGFGPALIYVNSACFRDGLPNVDKRKLFP